MLRIICTILLLIVLATVANAQADTPPGQMVSVGDHQLHIHCIGEGSPTVVIEAGLGEWSLHWRGVQETVSEFAHVCIYDRAGYGWSESGPSPRTSQQIVEELHTLLTNAGIEPPYVLVGHSLGGLTMRLFTALYPEDTAGFVSVDAATLEQITVLGPLWELWVEDFAQFPQWAEFVESGFITPDDVPLQANMPEEDSEQFQAQTATVSFFITAHDEFMSLPQSFDAVREHALTLGTLPMIVIGAALPYESPQLTQEQLNEIAQANIAAQEALAEISSAGTFVLAGNSPHHVQFHEPEVIVEAVRTLVQGE